MLYNGRKRCEENEEERIETEVEYLNKLEGLPKEKDKSLARAEDEDEEEEMICYEVDDPLDMVLDDRTARNYHLDSPNMGDSGFMSRRTEPSILDDEYLGDQVADMISDDDYNFGEDD